MLLRHADVVAAAHQPEVFSSGVSRDLQLPNGLDGDQPVVLNWTSANPAWY